MHVPNVPDVVVYKDWDDSVERDTTTVASLDATQDSGNILKTQSMAMPNVPLPRGIGTCGSPRCQETMRGSIAQTRSERVPTLPHDSHLPRVNTLGSDEGKDSSKQWRMIEGIDQDKGITLVTLIKITSSLRVCLIWFGDGLSKEFEVTYDEIQVSAVSLNYYCQESILSRSKCLGLCFLGFGLTFTGSAKAV
nr:hypothetical protein [Tanacetum cinerariifolium]